MNTNNPTLFISLTKAQASFHSALKDTANPFFKSKYADLTAVWDACKDALAANKLFVSQQPTYVSDAAIWAINTKVYNEAGEFIEGLTPIIASKQNDPQAFGSAMTYARRYGLASTLGIVTDDDDAEGAMQRTPPASKYDKTREVKEDPKPNPKTLEQESELKKLIGHGYITKEEREYVEKALPSLDFATAVKWIAQLTTKIKDRKPKLNAA